MTPPGTYQEFAQALGGVSASLSPQQRVIAQFVLANPDDVALGTAATVADAAGVQPSALVRFANVMHLSGFSELQRLCRDRLLARAGTYRERIGAMKTRKGGARGEDVLPSLVAAGVDDLQHLEQSVSQDVLRKAAQAIVKGRCVHVLAQRRAFPVAAYLAYALAQLELRVQLHDGVGGMLNESLRTLETNDVLLVTSFQNYSADVINAARQAHRQDIAVIAITDTPMSPLAACAIACLQTGNGHATPVRSLVSAMCLAQALVISAGQSLIQANRSKKR